jgi:hypothetical protein
LLPGPRDRDGLPDSIRFWKTRIETADADDKFSVGLIYGPSGCGKSSLVKAGLLPRLAKASAVVYVEATAEDTEARLLKGLRRQLPNLPASLALTDSLAALRQGRFLAAGQSVLLVLDQFEQWLHAKRNENNTELVQALRQCDGGRLQSIVMVRDDFWMAATRFMAGLEINLVQGQNCAAVDLFDLLHARKVLAAFGRSYGRLPDQIAKEQEAFLDQAVAGLAQEGKVISVRLALFAEMVKGKPWTPATLKEIGGTQGVGVTFLEETFSASTAPPQHRLHQKAAQAVLTALLPETGTDIKGNMRSQQHLLHASGYATRPADFNAVLQILDRELRLITPTDPEGVEEPRNDKRPRLSVDEAGNAAAGQPASEAACGYEDSRQPAGEAPRQPAGEERYYQLTHDYLVPSLRDWLTRKQKETRRGRAQLLLADRAAVWNARRENRQLPSLWQWLTIRSLTQKRSWTGPQRKMMRIAARYHALRGVLAALVLTLAGWGVYEARGTLKAHALRDQLLYAKTEEVPAIVSGMADYRPWLDSLLRAAHDEAVAAHDSGRLLHLSLALLPVDPDPDQADYLYERLLDAAPHELPIIRDALLKQEAKSAAEPSAPRVTLAERLQQVLLDARADPEKRLRAACALGGCDAAPDADACWQGTAPRLVDQLLLAVQKNPSHYGPLVELLRPQSAYLLDALGKVYRNRERPESERAFATNMLAAYAAEQPEVLADLLIDGDAKQHAVLFDKVKSHAGPAVAFLQRELKKTPPSFSPEPTATAAAPPKEILRKQGTITDDDPKVKVSGRGKPLALPAKVFSIDLKAGKKYAINMTSSELDSFLVLQDKNGKRLAVDDDGGGNLNALLIYPALKNDSYRIVAAALARTGSFTLTVSDATDVEAAAQRRKESLKKQAEAALKNERAKDNLAKRQANAAVALLKMGHADQVWPLLKRSAQPDDPRRRSYLIHAFAPLAADPQAIVNQLNQEQDATIRRALLLVLGSFSPEPTATAQGPTPPATAAGSGLNENAALRASVQQLYRSDPDAGVHAAAEWLLRTWKYDDWLRKVNRDWAAGEVAGGAWRVGGEAANQKSKIQNPPPGTSTPRAKP